MDRKALRYFQQVVVHGGYTAAANALHVAQPAVSAAIHKLEDELDVALFSRRERQVALTDEGQRLLPYAERILSQFADAEHEMRELQQLQQGEVRIGIPSMMGSYYFPPLLMAFREHYPGLHLSVLEEGSWLLRQRLLAGELDLAVMVANRLPDDLQAVPLLETQMMVTLGQDHVLARQRSISLDDFFDQELVMFAPGYFHRKIVDQLAQQAGRKPNIVFTTNLVPLIKAIVRKGFGISTLLELAVSDDPELVCRPFSEQVRMKLSLVWRKEGYLSKANRAFIEFIQEQ